MKAIQSLMFKQRRILNDRPSLSQFHYDSERECLSFTDTCILVEIFEPDTKESIVYRKLSDDISDLAFPKTGHLYSKTKNGRVELTYSLETLRRLEKSQDTLKSWEDRTMRKLFEGKKFQDEEMNKSTRFNNLGFSSVEVDTQKYLGQEFKRDVFIQLENDWEKCLINLPQAEENHLYILENSVAIAL